MIAFFLTMPISRTTPISATRDISILKMSSARSAPTPADGSVELTSFSGDVLVELPGSAPYHALVIAVAHRQFRAMTAADFRCLCVDQGVIYDVKHLLAEGESDGRL